MKDKPINLTKKNIKASEFVNTFAFASVKAIAESLNPMPELEDAYDELHFILPRLICKDGFSISIQVHNGNYCESENGYQTFGLDWRKVEWGFPSEEIDPEKYNAECDYIDNTTNSVGSCSIGLIDELCEEHGGFDLVSTLKEGEKTIRENFYLSVLD